MADFNQIWTEKYRPKTLDEMINQEHIVERLKAFVKDGSIPHMLFAGPPGVGKTTAAMALARELFGEHWRENYMETNASDERGIDVIRSKIKDFARTKPIGGKFKIIFLDEADALTRDAQQALRRTMEIYSSTCRFILSCNYPSKIIEPIQSRCVVFRFRPFTEEDIIKMLRKIAANEGLTVDEEAYRAIAEIAAGDARYAINLLQAAAATDDHVTEEDVYEAAARAKPKEIAEILDLALKGQFLQAREKLIELLTRKGVSGDLIIKELHNQAMRRKDITEEEKVELAELIGEAEFRLMEGATELIQLDALLAKISAFGRRRGR